MGRMTTANAVHHTMRRMCDNQTRVIPATPFVCLDPPAVFACLAAWPPDRLSARLLVAGKRSRWGSSRTSRSRPGITTSSRCTARGRGSTSWRSRSSRPSRRRSGSACWPRRGRTRGGWRPWARPRGGATIRHVLCLFCVCFASLFCCRRAGKTKRRIVTSSLDPWRLIFSRKKGCV